MQRDELLHASLNQIGIDMEAVCSAYHIPPASLKRSRI